MIIIIIIIMALLHKTAERDMNTLTSTTFSRPDTLLVLIVYLLLIVNTRLLEMYHRLII